jgi:hypothetical protein
VLIDFGSARFEAAEATSTKVTFHTPPYAAIEQYVKTYPQGPWTDVYALGVVMYECVTGEKPPEVLERLHAGLGKPLAEGKWPGYSKQFLAAIDAGMVVKPDDRPQSIADWLAMFGKVKSAAPEGDEATRFYAKQVETEDIAPVPPTPNVDPKTPVATGVPADPKQAKFKLAGEETRESKKLASEEEAAEAAGIIPSRKRVVGTSAEAAAAAPAVAKAAKTGEQTAEKKRKPGTVMMAGAALAVLAIAGVGALTLRGGSSGPEAAGPQVAPSADNSPGTIAALGAADGTTDANAAANAAVAETQPTPEANAADALRSEKTKAAAAEAQLAALKKAAARAASAGAAPGAATASTRNDKAAAAAALAASSAATTAGVSPAKMAQFNASVDEGRSMAKQAMRSGNQQNAQLAKNYDKYLKTLKDSMRGIESDKEADKLIRQANQTKAYIQFLLRDQ